MAYTAPGGPQPQGRPNPDTASEQRDKDAGERRGFFPLILRPTTSASASEPFKSKGAFKTGKTPPTETQPKNRAPEARSGRIRIAAREDKRDKDAGEAVSCCRGEGFGRALAFTLAGRGYGATIERPRAKGTHMGFCFSGRMTQHGRGI